jgi:hypothetical protein
MGVWACGRVGVWACGRVGVWARRRGGVRARLRMDERDGQSGSVALTVGRLPLGYDLGSTALDTVGCLLPLLLS